MSDDQATARYNAAEQERKRKEMEDAAHRKMIGTTMELPNGNKGVWTSSGQLQVLPKEKENKEEVYQGDFVRVPGGTIQEWNPAKEIYTPVKPDAVQMEDQMVPIKDKKGNVLTYDKKKVPVEKDRWAKVQVPDKREVFESAADAEAAKLPKGTKLLVKDEKTGKYRPAVVQ
jgi:hypothetical protein